MDTVQAQRMALGRQAEVTTSLIDGLGESMADQSQVLYDYFTSSFEHFAGLVEALETSLYNLKLEETGPTCPKMCRSLLAQQDAPRQIQREFGPLLVPSVVLVCIITASNCYFGFLLASDESLADALSARLAHPGGNTTDAVHSEMSEMNILFLFAVAHVVLIGLAIVYIVIDLFRRWCRRRRRSSGRFSLAGSFLDSEDEDELESVDEDQDEGGDESIDELPEANPVAGPAASQPAGQAERKSTSAPPDRSGDRLSVSTGNRVSWWSSRSSRRSQAPRVSVGKSNFHGASRGLRFSQLLRRVQHAALRDSPPRAVSEGIFRLSSEWAGICRVKDNEIAVRVAAASGSTVITTIANGRRIEVVQAIRGGRGKIWGRIASPPGWILLADQQTGFKAVAKVKEAVTSKPLMHLEGSVSSKTAQAALDRSSSNSTVGWRAPLAAAFVAALAQGGRSKRGRTRSLCQATATETTAAEVGAPPAFETDDAGRRRLQYNSEGWSTWQWRGTPDMGEASYKINYITAGPSDGKRILLVHGFGASSYHWRYQVANLAEQGYRVYSLCLLGYGWSDRAILPYSGEVWAAQINDFLREVAGGPAVLVGNSIGAFATLLAASLDPQLCGGLVLLNAAGRFEERQPGESPAQKQAGDLVAEAEEKADPGPVQWLLQQVRRALASWAFYSTKLRIQPILEWVYVNGSQVDEDLVTSIRTPAEHPDALDAFTEVIQAGRRTQVSVFEALDAVPSSLPARSQS
eukprot:g9714.t1